MEMNPEQYKKLEEEKEKLKDEIWDLTASVLTCKMSIDIRDTEINELKEEAKNTRKEINKLKKEKETDFWENHQLRKEINKLKEENKKLKEQNKSL